MPLPRIILRTQLASPTLVLGALLAASIVLARTETPVALADPTSTLNRPADPVIMTGAQIPSLNGIAPSDLVAFRNVSGVWQQIPVQVDERAYVSFGAAYNGVLSSNFQTLAYTDVNTFAGPDPDPMIDGNDEIVVMAKDAGGSAASFSVPAGVIAGTGVEVIISDPLVAGDTGVVYFFEQDGSLDPAAGQQYVSYNFNLLSGNYLATYDTLNGPNPEDSDVNTPYYTHHFADRWVSDELSITSGGATGVDILDRHRAQFAPTVCGRSEDTFSNAEGAFFVNKSGPIRALRSYFGANSGPLTQRDHAFYEQRQDITTHLRVHAIASVMDFMDYSPAAAGMTYYNSFNSSPGAIIDGVDEAPSPDNVVPGPITWEFVTGPQGSLTLTGQISTNIGGFAYTSYWLDDSSPPANTQCTGDGQAWGNSGVYVNQNIPCTDPDGASGCTFFLRTRRTLHYGAPAMTVSQSQQHEIETANALTVAVARWLDATADTDGDGILDAADNCPTVLNPDQASNDRNFIDLSPPKAYDDITLAMSDDVGDACDADNDNDGLSAALELAGPCASASGQTNPLLADTDGDRVLDGAECALGTDPLNPLDFPTAAECGPAIDSDGDGVLDFRETCYYGTNPHMADSDGDGCSDGQEIASINGDTTVNIIDLQQIAQHIGPGTSPQYLVNMDITKDGSINIVDLQQAAAQLGVCHP